MILQQKIYKYFISLIFCTLLSVIANAQSDSTKTIADTTTIKKDSIKIKPKKFANWQPTAFFLGVDIAKLSYNILDKNKVRIESEISCYLKNKNWITAQVGYANAKFNSNNLQFTSNSTGILFNLQKSLFPFNNAYDKDNAFAGVGYGLAINNINQASYTISSLWGTTNGVVEASNNMVHFVELNAGFRIAITKKLMMGWRMQGKTLINTKILSNIAPIYIANYGKGDKAAIFGYNLMVAYQIH